MRKFPGGSAIVKTLRAKQALIGTQSIECVGQ